MGHKLPSRTFGVELELAGLSQEQAFLVLRMAGLPVEDPCRHESQSVRMTKWRFHEDGSIRDTRNPDVTRTVEVVSPILTGAKGLKEIRRACAALEKAGGYVNDSCGLHVHVGAKDLTVAEVLTLCKRYTAYESFIDSVVHPSRRADANRYCHSVQRTLNDVEWSRYVERIRGDIRSYARQLAVWDDTLKKAEEWARPITVGDVAAHFSGQTTYPPLPREMSCYDCQRGRRGAIRGADGYYHGSYRCTDCRYQIENVRQEAASYRSTVQKLEALIAKGTWDSVEDMCNQVADRYRAVNLHAFPRHGTVEFRQHHGSLSGDKVTAWVTFVLEFVERSRKVAKSADKAKDTGPMMGLPKRIKDHFEARRRIMPNARYQTWA